MKKKLMYLTLILLVQIKGISFANDQVLYPYMGPVNQIAAEFISIGDFKLRLSPTVKVRLENNKPGQLFNVKKGQLVGATILKIDKKQYVDTIFLLNRP